MKKQIYITALHLEFGGVERAIALMSNAFVKRGYGVTVLSLYNLGEPAYIFSDEVKIEYLTSVKPNREEFKAAIKSKNPIKILKEGMYALKVLRLKKTAMAKRLRQIDDGIVISTRNEHSVLLSKYGKKNVLKIAQLHHDHCFNKKLLSDFKNRYDNIDYFALLTDQLTDEVSKIMEKTNKHTKCLTIENFLAANDEDIDFGKKEKTVVAVGRLHQVKGFDRLLDIWAKTVKKAPDWKLYIVGEGDQRDVLTEKIKMLGIENQVVLTGELPYNEVLEAMRKASVYAMTSFSEGFPFVLIEAFSSALPTVAFDVRVGPRAIIEDKKNGLLIEDGDFEGFNKALCSLLIDEQLRLQYAKAAVMRAADFTEENIVDKWVSIFN